MLASMVWLVVVCTSFFNACLLSSSSLSFVLLYDMWHVLPCSLKIKSSAFTFLHLLVEIPIGTRASRQVSLATNIMCRYYLVPIKTDKRIRERELMANIIQALVAAVDKCKVKCIFSIPYCHTFFSISAIRYSAIVPLTVFHYYITDSSPC